MQTNGHPVITVEDPQGRRVPLEIVGQLPPSRVAVGRPAKRAPSVRSQSRDLALAGPLTVDVLKRQWNVDRALDLITAIRDLDPMVSQAVWNYLRLLNPGHQFKAYVFAADGSEVEEGGQAQAVLDELVRRVGADYGGGLDQLHNVLSLSLLTHGAVALEVAPSEDLTTVEDWYPIIPNLLSYRREPDGTLTLGQVFADGTFRPVNTEQVFYQPLDPEIEVPYGRMPLLGVIQAVLAKHALLADLRAVAHNQGFPRIDVKVLWEAIERAAPPALKAPGNEAAYAEWAEHQLSSIVSEYEKLAIDDTFVHYDWIELDMVGSTTPGGTSFNFKELDRIITEQVNAALKSLPILNGTLDSDEHGHGSIQWQIQVAGIAALQRVIKRVIEKAGNVTLALHGFAAHSKLTYDPIRSVDRLYEAQSNLFEAKALEIDVMMGWRDNDEAAILRSGHKAVSPPIPDNPPGANSDVNANNSGDKNKGAGGDAPTTPSDAEKGQSGQESPDQWAAWQLLTQPRSSGYSTRNPTVVGYARNIRKRVLDLEEFEAQVEVFERQATIIFYGAMDELVAELNKEGWELRDVPKDVADYVFGLRYSRQMKGLLRDAVRRGMIAAGVAEPTPNERLVDRVWNENRQYVLKIRDDLKRALRDGEFNTLDDVRRWFDDNAYRESLMGRYLAKQGITGGYAFVLTEQRGETTTFIWRLGVAEHCESCESRNGAEYTYAELLSVGLPGSGALKCGANCKCSLEESN